MIVVVHRVLLEFMSYPHKFTCEWQRRKAQFTCFMTVVAHRVLPKLPFWQVHSGKLVAN